MARAAALALRWRAAGSCTAVSAASASKAEEVAAAAHPSFAGHAFAFRFGRQHARGHWAAAVAWPQPQHLGIGAGSVRRHGGYGAASASGETIRVTFVEKDGEELELEVPVGVSLLEVAHANDIELEGACEGSLACSTCHVVVEDEAMYEKMEEPNEDEEDMLDLAFGLTETSRLGCQIITSADLDGLRVRIPAATRNMAVDGYVPKPH